MGSIRLVTDIPGPRSRELAQRALGTVARPVLPYGEVFIEKGAGAVVEDVDGNRFLDLIGGVGCLIVGHSHPRVLKAITDQAASSVHTDFSLIPYEVYVSLAERLSDLCGGERKVAFFNSGAEAVENAIKVARGSTGRSAVVCFDGAFHGRTLMALTLTHREVPHKQGFGPFAPDVHRVPYPGLKGATIEQSLDAVESVMRERNVAAVIVEPVLGEGGFIVPPLEFLPSLAETAQRHGAVLIADEIQSGYGRTGTFLASEQFDVRPDVITLGKSIAAGLPLSAVVGEPRFMDALDANAIGGTYVGNPVACAAGLAVLEVMHEEHLLARAIKVGDRLRAGWVGVADEFSIIKEIRGLGAMVAVEFHDPDITRSFISESLRRGVLAMTAGVDHAAIRHLMPLVITDEGLDEVFQVFSEVASKLS